MTQNFYAADSNQFRIKILLLLLLLFLVSTGLIISTQLLNCFDMPSPEFTFPMHRRNVDGGRASNASFFLHLVSCIQTSYPYIQLVHILLLLEKLQFLYPAMSLTKIPSSHLLAYGMLARNCGGVDGACNSFEFQTI